MRVWGFIPVAFTPIQSSLLFLVYNCFYGKHLRIKKIYSKLYRGKTFHQMWTWRADDLSITYLTGTYPCPRNEEHYPPLLCVFFSSLDRWCVCIMFPSFVLLFSCFGGKDWKNIISGFCSHTIFFVEDLLLVSTQSVCGLDNNETKKKRNSVRGREVPVYPLTNLTVYTYPTTTPPPYERVFIVLMKGHWLNE